MIFRRLMHGTCHRVLSDRLKNPCNVNPLFFVRLMSDNAGESYMATRLEMLEKHKINPYPHGFKTDTSVAQIINKYQVLQTGEVADNSYKIGGIITNIRESGRKLKFIDVLSDGNRIQLKLHATSFSSLEEFENQTTWARRGDRIGVEGRPCRTKSGELSLNCFKVILLAPCLHILPKNTLENTTKRLSRRYLDILTNPNLRETLVTRSKIIRFIRRYLEGKDFLEVETPILGNSVGGASANPFVTYHNEMEIDLYMRVAPELYLKQLVVAGFDRVFEIGKLFRNEGIDHSHNPEFTSCELYMAYSDYTGLMALTNNMFKELTKKLNLSGRANLAEVDFSSDYQRLEFLPAIESAVNAKLPDPDQLTSDDSFRFLVDLCSSKELVVQAPVTVPRMLDKLAANFVEPNLQQPTFLVDHPIIMSPLAKSKPENNSLAERFELFAGGLELCNAYTELNDPEIQRTNLAAQAGLLDPEAMLPDEGFCRALEYGLPPTAGWGCGIDRLTALLTNNTNIRETITFPLIKPKIIQP